MVVHACNPSTLEAEPGGAKVQGQPGLRSSKVSYVVRIEPPSPFLIGLSKALSNYANIGVSP